MAVPVPVRIVGGSSSVGTTVEVTQTTGSDLHAVIDSGTISTITNVVHVDDNSGNISIDDGGNSITVDYATTGSGTAAGAVRVELPTNGTGVIATLGTITNVVHVDDNSASLTVDNAGTFAVQAAQSGTWTVALSADAITYNPLGGETGLVVRPLPNPSDAALLRAVLVLTDEVRLLRGAFQAWSRQGDPFMPMTDYANIPQ